MCPNAIYFSSLWWIFMKIRVLFCMSSMTLGGGVESVALNLIEKLIDSDEYEITLSLKKKPDTYFIEWFVRKNIRILYKFSNFSKPKNIFLKLYWECKQYCKIVYNIFFASHSYDVIIDFKNCGAYSYIKNIRNIPKITWLHGGIPWFNERIRSKYNLQKYDAVVCLSKTMQTILQDDPQYAQTRMYHIYNSIDREEIVRIANTTKSIEKDTRYFVCVSRLDKDKDIDTVISAYNQFQQKCSGDILLYIIGTGSEQVRLESYTQSLGLEKNVIFLGLIYQPYAYMKDAVASILSSYSEGCPMVLLESMALNTLCVASDCPSSIKEILLDGKAGILFNPGSVEELRNIFIAIYNDDLDVTGMVHCAEESLTRFQYTTVLEQIHTMIQDVREAYTAKKRNDS